MRRSPVIPTLAAGLLGLLAPSIAAALDAPQPSQTVLVDFYGAASSQTSTSSGSLNLGLPSNGVAAHTSLTLTGVGGGGPGVYAYTNQGSPIFARTDAEASSYLGYQFEVTGSPGPVKVTFTGDIGMLISGDIYQIATFADLMSGGYNLASAGISCHNDYQTQLCSELIEAPSVYVSKNIPHSMSTSYTQPFGLAVTLSANEVYDIFLAAQVEDGSDCQTGAACEGIAFADPLIQIDPSTPDAGSYQVELSPGVSNALGDFAVPEPAAWVLMLLGVGSVGAALRRGRMALAGSSS
jgi:hypothetical protein